MRVFLSFLVAFVIAGCASFSPRPTGSVILTTSGPMRAAHAGVILPHEHIFTDLRGPEAPGYGQADPEDVVRVMKPLLLKAKDEGVDTIIECSTIGVGRNLPVMARLARETGLHIVVPTGVYGRANFAPRAYRDMTEQQLTGWMTSEIENGIEGTRVRAGFIKLASSENELKPLEEKFLRAAARAARQTGVVIASHTTSGKVALRQAEVIEQEKLPLNRFIWVHAQAERDFGFHQQLAARGVYIEYDSLGANPMEDDQHLRRIRELHAAGFGDRVLLSHDAGWYNPGQPAGGKQRPYTYLLTSFVLKLRAEFDERTVQMFIRDNPRRAFALSR